MNDVIKLPSICVFKPIETIVQSLLHLTQAASFLWNTYLYKTVGLLCWEQPGSCSQENADGSQHAGEGKKKQVKSNRREQ